MIIFLVSFVVFAGFAGTMWALYQFYRLNQIKVTRQRHQESEDLEETPNKTAHISAAQIGAIIEEEASQLIQSQWKASALYLLLMSGVVWICVDQCHQLYTTIAFLFGATTSALCGAIGVRIAVFANYRVALEAEQSLGSALKAAYRAACIIGFVLSSLSLLVLLVIIMAFKDSMALHSLSVKAEYFQKLFESVAGFGLGNSAVALLARVGGGFFAQAADLGSDLVGRVDSALIQNNLKNPAVVAEKVGKNVGDVAGMGTDLSESLAGAIVAAMILGSTSLKNLNHEIEVSNILFVLAIPAAGIVVCVLVSFLLTELSDISEAKQVETRLKNQSVYSSIVLLPCFYFLSLTLLNQFSIDNQEKSHKDVFVCLSMGLTLGTILGNFTEAITSSSSKAVQELAESCRTGAATNLIQGLALGYGSTVVPVCGICLVCYFSHVSLGFFGVSLAVLGMLSNFPIHFAVHCFGSIANNAMAIAEIASMPSHVRKITETLSSAGKTTAVIGKGFASGSAILVGYSLYGAFLRHMYQLNVISPESLSFDSPLFLTLLLLGSAVPYFFSASTIKSVGTVAIELLEEVKRQIKQNPKILNGNSLPDYKKMIRVASQNCLEEMRLPVILVTATPFALGYFLSPEALLGFLPGVIISSAQMAISASNSGGAWENAKKYVEMGKLKDKQGQTFLKGSEAHLAATNGRKVGSPLNGMSGPSLNTLIKLMTMLSLVFCRFFSQ